MILLMIIFSFLFGLAIGSFVNALVYRLAHEEKGLWNGRSMCPTCRHPLNTHDLIPLVSWLSLRGKCRYCHQPISAQYPLVELLTAVLLAIIGYVYWYNLILVLFFGVVTAGLVAISVFDIRYQLIPYKVSYTLIVLSIGFALWQPDRWWYLLAALLFGGWFWLLSRLKIRGQQAGGEGDAELGVILGALLGLKVGLLSLFLSYFAGAFFSVGLMLFSKNSDFNHRIPFGPFLSFGIYTGIIIGEPLLNLYLKLIGWY